MATVINTLYPPQISTFMPAFVNTEPAKIFFSLSSFNSETMIHRIQVSVVDQKTNTNCLKSISGIYFIEKADIKRDTETNRYYISIPTEKLQAGSWDINKFYKVQLRFDCTEGQEPPEEYTNESAKITYLTKNTLTFSEWSTVCLIKPILRPSVSLVEFDISETADPPSFNRGFVQIVGRLKFGEDSTVETETLQSYYIDIVPKGKDNAVYTTDIIYTANNVNPNSINTTINLNDISETLGDEFSLVVHYTTKNQYQGKSKEYPFTIAEYGVTDWNPTCTFQENDEEGNVVLSVTNKSIIGKVYITRSSNIYNFTKWETVAAYRVNGPVDIQYTDSTVGSNIWYQYKAQFKTQSGLMSDPYEFVREDDMTTIEAMVQFHEAFISRLDQQLDIRYDFKVSNYKPTSSRVKIDTLGGKYPRFAENAVLDYKQLSVTGMISAEADANQKFLNKVDYFDNMYSNYQNYLEENEIKAQQRNDFTQRANGNYKTTTPYDFFWEREFREAAIEWLNDGEPKLFRTMTEGLIPVMITDISLTPNATLGRRLYSFSATMYQVGEGHSLKELDSLGIINIPGYGDDDIDSPDLPDIDYIEVEKPWQLYDYWPEKIQQKDNTITFDVILGKLSKQIKEKYVGIKGRLVPELIPGEEFYCTDVKISFLNNPNAFYTDGQGNLAKIDPALLYDSTEDAEKMRQAYTSGNYRYGYRFDMRSLGMKEDSEIYIGNQGYYQTPKTVKLTSLTFPEVSDSTNPEKIYSGDNVCIEGIVKYRERAAEYSEISKVVSLKTIVGQEQGIFTPNEYLGAKIRKKHTYAQTSQLDNGRKIFLQYLQHFGGICFEAPAYTVVAVKYYQENEYRRFYIGQTCVLHLMSDNAVQDLYFMGRRLKRVDASRAGYLREWEFILDPNAADPTIKVSKKTWHLTDKTDTAKRVSVTEGLSTIGMFTDEWQGMKAEITSLQAEPIQVRALGDDGRTADIAYDSYNAFNQVPHPQINHVYLIDSTYYIYYINGNWYPIYSWSDNGDICVAEIPVEGQINYTGQIIRNYYN